MSTTAPNGWLGVARNFNSHSGFTPMPETASVTLLYSPSFGAFETNALFYLSRSLRNSTLKHYRTISQQLVVASCVATPLSHEQ